MRIWPGRPYPLGATWDGAGVNFALFSENATKVELCLFDAADAPKESHRIPLPEPGLLPTVVALPRGDAFSAILDRIVAEYQQRDVYTEAMIAAYMLQFAVLLRRALFSSRII